MDQDEVWRKVMIMEYVIKTHTREREREYKT